MVEVTRYLHSGQNVTVLSRQQRPVVTLTLTRTESTQN